jgi:cephalosporin-C deacetylase
VTETTARPADFEAYWEQIDRDLEREAPAPDLEPLELHSSDSFTVHALRITSLGAYRIFGYYSVPAGPGPFPGLLLTPSYGSVNHLPAYEDRERYAVLQIMHRGQRLADQPFAAAYPGLLTLGIEDPATYAYRAIVADCLRGAEFLLARPQVDRARVGLVGDDLALLTAARRPRFATLQVTGLLLYRLLDAAGRSNAYPVEEINDYLREHAARRDAVASTLAYFDARYHARQISADTQLCVGNAGSLGGPEWLQPLTEQLASRAVQYRLAHEGATDHDALDAWLARRLGVPARPRLVATGGAG